MFECNFWITTLHGTEQVSLTLLASLGLLKQISVRHSLGIKYLVLSTPIFDNGEEILEITWT